MERTLFLLALLLPLKLCAQGQERVTPFGAASLPPVTVDASLRKAAYPTPFLGVDTWPSYGYTDQTNVYRIITNMIDWGYVKAGYRWLTVNGMNTGGRDSNGFLLLNPNTFPMGTSNFYRMLVTNGFIPFVYSEPVLSGPGWRPNNFTNWLTAYSNMAADALMCKLWGIGGFRIDDASGAQMPDPETEAYYYSQMAAALDETGVPIRFGGYLNFGASNPWAPQVLNWGGHILNGDFHPSGNHQQLFEQEMVWWDEVYSESRVTGPGYHLYVDASNYDRDHLVNIRLYLTACAMFNANIELNAAASDAPLIASSHTNETMIAVHQDPAQIPGSIVWSDQTVSTNAGRQIIVRPLGSPSGENKAVVLLNRYPFATNFTVTWSDLTLPPDSSYLVYNIWSNTYSFNITNGFSYSVTSNNCAFLYLSPFVGDPGILSQPVSQTGHAGERVTFSVWGAGAAPLACQWWKDGDILDGATGSLLTIANLGEADAGEYLAVIRNGNGCSVTSAVAVLSVNLASVDPGFKPVANGLPYCFAEQPDGKILVAGSFDSLGGQPHDNIGRLNADGTVDASFAAGASGPVYSLVIQEDGRILVGGGFSNLNGQVRNNIGRLNPDGSVDNDFNPGTDSTVFALAVQRNRSILAGGHFHTLGAQTRNHIGRLNADGTVDGAFDPGADDSVRSLAVQPDGRILVAGEFSTLGGQSCCYLGRLNSDGTSDNNFNPGSLQGGDSVSTIAVQADGKILAGGSFQVLGGQSRNCIARLNADGNLDVAFDPRVGGLAPCVYSLAVQTDGGILVGGTFTNLGGEPRQNIGRLLPDGSVDRFFDPSASSTVRSLAVQTDGQVLAGGSFITLGGRPINQIGRLRNVRPATQGFSFEGSTVKWLRGGPGPEITRTELSHWNGAVWTGLGPGERTAHCWCWTNISVPAGVTVRSTGWIIGGCNNASSWLVETSIVTRAPGILCQPDSRTNNAGSSVELSVVASGTPDLSCQWYKDGAVLAGETGVNLKLANVKESDQGYYSVSISNSFGGVLSSNVFLFVNQAPIAVCRNVVVSADANCVAEASIDNGSFDPDGDPVTSWQAPPGPYPQGATPVKLFVADALGLTNSADALVTVVDTTPPTLALIGTNPLTNRCGVPFIDPGAIALDHCAADLPVTGSGNVNSQKPGSYRITYVAIDPLGNSITNTRTVVVSWDVPSPFIPMAGQYVGLFYDTHGGITVSNAGLVIVDVSREGVFSAQLRQGAKRVAFTGRFGSDGIWEGSSIKNTGLGAWLQLHRDDRDEITGQISNSGWTATVQANRRVYSRSNPAPQQGHYTLVIPGSADPAHLPGGHGALAVRVNSRGRVKVAGTLGDGTTVAAGAGVSKHGKWPLYVAPYSRKGILIGWLGFTNNPAAASDLQGLLHWTKPAQPGARFYPDGFDWPTGDGTENAFGCAFTNQLWLFSWTEGEIILEDGNLAGSIAGDITLGAKGRISGPNGVRLIITRSGVGAGLFKGSVPSPLTGTAIPVKGALLQKQDAGYGSFLGTNQSGSVLVGPGFDRVIGSRAPLSGLGNDSPAAAWER